jgi:hypothetical protein
MSKSRAVLEKMIEDLQLKLRKETAIRRIAMFCSGAIVTSTNSDSLALCVECENLLGLSHNGSITTSQMRDLITRALDLEVVACPTLASLREWAYKGL